MHASLQHSRTIISISSLIVKLLAKSWALAVSNYGSVLCFRNMSVSLLDGEHGIFKFYMQMINEVYFIVKYFIVLFILQIFKVQPLHPIFELVLTYIFCQCFFFFSLYFVLISKEICNSVKVQTIQLSQVKNMHKSRSFLLYFVFKIRNYNFKNSFYT